MPNESNATRPITLIGLGRSGTTLLEACFSAHPLIQTLNETAGVIFGLAAGAFQCPLPAKQRFDDDALFAGHAVRTAMTALEPSDKPYWFHKPGGLPKLINWDWQAGRRTATGFPVEWYWRVLKAAFPEALFITSLRNPWDVVLSWERYIGWRQEDVWQDVADIYDMLEAGSAEIAYTIQFEAFMTNPECVLQHILSLAGIPFDAAVLEGFSIPQAMSPGTEPRLHYRAEWDRCIEPPLAPDQAAKIVKVWSAAGHRFESPDRFAGIFQFDAR